MSGDFPGDDLDAWPSNPYQLFGLPRSAGERQIRQAYHRLIRRFKPDASPQHFRRIHECYESLMASLVREAPAADGTVDDSHWGDESIGQRERLRIRRPETTHSAAEAESAWALATAGDVAEATRRIDCLRERSPHDEDLVLRSFWLRRLARDLSERPLQILEDSLLQSGLSPRLFDLYYLELQRNPHEALSDRVRAILLANASNPGLLYLVRAVWVAYVELGKPERVIEDLVALRGPLAFDHPQIWRELIELAIELFTLIPLDAASPLWELVRKEQRELAPNPDDEYADSEREIVRRVGLALGEYLSDERSRRWMRLVRRALLVPAETMRPEFLEMCHTVFEGNPQSLWSLDRLARFSTVCVHVLRRTAERLMTRANWIREDVVAEYDAPLKRFLAFFGEDDFDAIRFPVADYCVDEDIPLDLFVELCLRGQQLFDESETMRDDNLARLHQDEALKCYVACLRLVRL